jgi:hypothetical protein
MRTLLAALSALATLALPSRAFAKNVYECLQPMGQDHEDALGWSLKPAQTKEEHYYLVRSFYKVGIAIDVSGKFVGSYGFLPAGSTPRRKIPVQQISTREYRSIAKTGEIKSFELKITDERVELEDFMAPPSLKDGGVTKARREISGFRAQVKIKFSDVKELFKTELICSEAGKPLKTRVIRSWIRD